MKLQIGEWVRVLNPNAINFGEPHWNKGDITEVVGYFEDDPNQPELRSTKSARYGRSLWIDIDELKYVKKVTPQEARAWVITQAFEFVAKHYHLGISFEYKGNTVTASLDGAVGVAKCSPDDKYNSEIGRAIAIARLLGLQVPVIFLHAPQVYVMEDLFEAVEDALTPEIEEDKTKAIAPEQPTQSHVDTTRPAHYHTGTIDVITFSEENFSREELIGFFRINVIKYVTRFDKKDQLDDLKKARFYLNKLEELYDE